MEVMIQRDGRVAIREHREPVRYCDVEDKLAIVHVFGAAVEFEEGLTLRQLVRALRPWADVLGRAAWMDFDAWAAALDKTHLAEADEEDEPLSCIEVFPNTGLTRGRDGELSISHIWDVHGRYVRPVEHSGFMVEVASFAFSPPASYANLPLKLITTAVVHDDDVGFPADKPPILKESDPGVYDRIEMVPRFFDAVVWGLLLRIGFHGSPEDEADLGEALKEWAQDAREHAERIAADPSLDDSVSVAGAFEMLGVDPDQGRSDARIGIVEALKELSLPDAELASKLGLSDVGLTELQKGVTARFSVEKLVEMAGIIEMHRG